MQSDDMASNLKTSANYLAGQVAIEIILSAILVLSIIFAFHKLVLAIRADLSTTTTWQEIIVRYHNSDSPYLDDLDKCQVNNIFNSEINCQVQHNQGFSINIKKQNNWELIHDENEQIINTLNIKQNTKLD